MELLGFLGCFAFAVFAIWFVDHWRFHSTSVCQSCKALRRVDRNGTCYHCYEHDGGWC